MNSSLLPTTEKRGISILLDHKLKGLGHKIKFQYVDKNVYSNPWSKYTKSLYYLFNIEDEPLLWAVVFATFQAVKVKTYGRNTIYWSSLPNHLTALLVTPVVH